MVIVRYITKQVSQYFIIILLSLLLISLSNQLSQLLTQTANGQLPVGLVANTMLYYIPELLSILVPIAFLLAVFLLQRKMHMDNELIIMFNAGFSWHKVMLLCLCLAGITASLLSVNTNILLPIALTKRLNILNQQQVNAFLQSVTPEKIYSLPTEEHLHIGNIDKQGNWQRVWISRVNPKDKTITIIIAEQAKIWSLGLRQFYLSMQQGERWVIDENNNFLSKANFAKYQRLIEHPSPIENHKHLSTNTLIASHNSADKVELQWRFAMPVATIVLTIFAGCLSFAANRKKQQELLRGLAVVVIYIGYYNSLLIARHQADYQVVATYAITVVHAIFLCISLCGWWYYGKYKT